MLTCPECRATFPEGTAQCPDDKSELLPAELLPTPDPTLQPGAMVGEYQVLRKLGAGTFGEVYAGEQPLIGKRVAIKVLRERFSSDAQVITRFISEARAVNRIRHRNIIDIFSFGTLEGHRHYFVMELCDGLTLGQLLHRERRLTVDKALPILAGIASALDAAHAAGVTHRDLKPDNIFLVEETDGGYFPKLLDFGIAKLVSDDAVSKTATGVALGTPRYMAPEQCRGKRVDHRADVYALGVVIHEMLTGKAPFDGETALELMMMHMADPPPRMSTVHADLPPDLDEPVAAMLAKRANDRPSSCGAAVAALAERARSTAVAATISSGRVVPEEALAVGARDSGQAPTVERVPDLAGAIARSTPGDEAVATGITVVARRPPPEPGAPTLRSTLGVGSEVAEVASGARTVLAASRSPGAEPPGTALEQAGSGAPVQTRIEAPSPGALTREPAVPAPPTPARPGRTWPFLVAIAGLAAGALALVKGSGQPPPAAPAASASARPASGDVMVRFAVDPSDADVLVDGRRVGSAREAVTLPRSDQSRAIRLAKEGYEGKTVWVVPDRDRDVGPLELVVVAPAASALQGPPLGPGSATKPVRGPGYHGDLERPRELQKR